MTELNQLKNYSREITEIKQRLDYYNNNLFNNIFDECEYENEHNYKAYKRGETIYDKFDENLNNLNLILEKEQNIIEFFNKCRENKQRIIDHQNELINKLLKIKKNDKNVSKEEYNKCKKEWNKRRIETPDVRNRRECEEMLEEIKEQLKFLQQKQKEFEQVKMNQQELDELLEMRKEREKFSIENEFNELAHSFVTKDEMNELMSSTDFSNNYSREIDNFEDEEEEEFLQETHLTRSEIKQLEEWTGLKCGKIIFNSDIDNWDLGSTVFYDRIFGKKQLLFLIEEERGQKFGYYCNTEMLERPAQRVETDTKTFQFNLYSHGRLPGPMKFEIRNTQYGGYNAPNKNTRDDYRMISLGDIVIYKEGKKYKSYCCQFDERWDYHGIKNALHGREKINYIPSKVVVIQMEEEIDDLNTMNQITEDIEN